MPERRYRKAFLLLLVVLATVSFVVILESFLVTILMAAVFAGLARPLFVRLERLFRGRRPLASAVTLLLLLSLIVVPLAGVLGVVVSQAIRVTGSITPVVQRFINEPTLLDDQLRRLPGFDRLEPYRGQILTTAGDVVNSIGSFLIASLSSGTIGTVSFVFQAVLGLYTMFFLLMDGPGLWKGIVRHLPLTDDDERQMTERFLSVTRATVKGTLIIGLVQGALSGFAFWLVGIPDAMFWGVVMALLSILPMIGGALVWVPACLVLLATGAWIRALVLAAFCSLVVGSVDNLLRPRLVGRDTKMHDLVILFSTLGGLAVFGAVGFIVGPILAGLVITTWHIFAIAYGQPDLPAVVYVQPSPDADGIRLPQESD